MPREQVDTMPLSGSATSCEHRPGWTRVCPANPGGTPPEVDGEARTHGDVRWLECTRCGEVWSEKVEH